MTGSFTIDGDDEQYVTVSVRQTAECSSSSEEEQIDVKSLNIANGGDYSVSLPVGTYSVVASIDDKETQEYVVDIIIELDIEF